MVLQYHCRKLYSECRNPADFAAGIREWRVLTFWDTVYDSDTAVPFSMFLVPIGKGILLRPTHIIDLPPNSISLPVYDLPHSVTLSFFYNKSNPNPDVQAFVRDYAKYIKEVSNREHRSDL